MSRLACVVGARPNFMKMAPILRALEKHPEVETALIHTGQHYDKNLSDIFFEELRIKKPDVSLGVGSGSQAEQTANLLIGLERTFLEARQQGQPFQRVVVVGDVNSTLAATLAAAKLEIPVAHVEAGLRSFDRSMPEEINRLATDCLSDMLLVSEPAGVANLLKEGHPQERIHLVGNVMIDTLLEQVREAQSRPLLDDLELEAGEYAVVTLHRPSNVDDPRVLGRLMDVLARCSRRLRIVFPTHPRTRGKLEAAGLIEKHEHPERFRFLNPLGYNDFLCLTSQAKVVITDSGGLQEESTALGVPCLTMRSNTERPITVTEGTSVLCGSDSRKLLESLEEVLAGTFKRGRRPALWDGRAAERIASCLAEERRQVATEAGARLALAK
jgi:UDP-N-acetylglucosamine 2-epimerase (non-hydrolysing)